MAALSDNDRAALTGEFARELSADREVIAGYVKADLRAAVNALDQYLVDNAAAINTAIPQPARGALTIAQKARLMKHVITKRYQTGA
jgi:hypothetical protein